MIDQFSSVSIHWILFFFVSFSHDFFLCLIVFFPFLSWTFAVNLRNPRIHTWCDFNSRYSIWPPHSSLPLLGVIKKSIYVHSHCILSHEKPQLPTGNLSRPLNKHNNNIALLKVFFSQTHISYFFIYFYIFVVYKNKYLFYLFIWTHMNGL